MADRRSAFLAGLASLLDLSGQGTVARLHRLLGDDEDGFEADLRALDGDRRRAAKRLAREVDDER